MTNHILLRALFLALSILMTFMSIFGSLSDLVQNKKLDISLSLVIYLLTAISWATFYMITH